MVNYTCLRCGYATKRKTIFIKHLNRKFVCEPKLNNISIDEIYNKYFNYDNSVNSVITIQNVPKTIQNIPSRSKTFQKKYICEHCDKTYSTKSNLNKHLKKCKEKIIVDKEYNDLKNLVKLLNEQLNEKTKSLEKELEIKNKQLKEKDKQIDAKDKQINELIKKAGITTNIQNNIKVLAYKNTDISHLTNKDFLFCFNRSNMCIPSLIKKIHFNPEKPENHNVYISNIKNNFVMFYDGDKWVIKDRDESIQDLIDTNEFILEQKLEEWVENGKKYPEIMKKFNNYLEKKENDSVLNSIKK